jgi:hypothetical protein
MLGAGFYTEGTESSEDAEKSGVQGSESLHRISESGEERTYLRKDGFVRAGTPIVGRSHPPCARYNRA